ncbi:tRNA pseudouridine(55) synthase TruB [Mycoplasma marinum]|uniref:tRNA pseudouridine synthase B n=1 Tax=Mycoplasma marinum TaxID=1937190 RepID=A0A4R0XVT8_9MOLU|nr:tRNA pseudouridine(55) synthase TruB [Mycoplasma marinum]TCG11905.1 tRNA pseudouridine(55) synthase TruB [Mycoplasma marinum]
MFILLDKEKGISSFKAINNFRRENNIKKIGHTGTLDPLATGLLLVASDEDTKLIDFIDKGEKTYIATMELGCTSNTYDSEGEIKYSNNALPSSEKLEYELQNFIGIQEQMPPIFSAKKVNGTSAYKLAREGKEVKLKASTIKINKIKLLSYNLKIATFEVNVSRGTYIRSIIHDLGQILGCGAIMTELRRTTIGPLSESDLGIDINIDKLLTLPIIELSKQEIKILVNGISIPNTSEKKGKFIAKVNGIICGIVILEERIKSQKLFGKKIGQL